MGPLRFYPFLIGGGVALLGFSAYAFARARRKTPEEIERERREFINSVGRITDGAVLDVNEFTTKDATFQVLLYSYDVAGVGYEASQDITHLRQLVDVHDCRGGLPTSVKYDPQYPGNSMVVSESWNGLRTGDTTVIRRSTLVLGKAPQKLFPR